jgi:predicted transposase/invertase (TIGR01784 family)
MINLNDGHNSDYYDEKILKYLKKIEKANLVEDIKFREVAKSKEAIEEILRVILKDDDLEVIKCIDQKSLSKSVFHGVILDCECILSTKEIVNVEMQVDLKDDPVYRMRYNQSALTIAHSPKSKQFNYSELPKIISIMVCKFDLFKKGKSIYEVIRNVQDCGITADNGIRELYVNLTSKEVKETKLSDLFKMFIDYDYENELEFPNLTEKKKEINGKLRGGYPMTGISREIFMDGKAVGIAEGKAEGKAEGFIVGMQELLIELYSKNMITKEYAAKKLSITEEEFLKLIK